MRRSSPIQPCTLEALVEVGKGYFLIIGLAFLTAGSGMFLYAAVRSLVTRRSVRLRYLNMALMCLYMIGVGCKAALIGPEFVRFHLSDIGFPVMLSFMLYMHGQSKVKDESPKSSLELLDENEKQVRHRQGSLLVALGMSYGYEILTGVMYATIWAGHPVEFVGSFDWNDMAYYTLGALLSGLLLWGQIRFTQGSRTALTTAEEHVRQAEIAENRVLRRARPKKSRKPGQRRGGRR